MSSSRSREDEQYLEGMSLLGLEFNRITGGNAMSDTMWRCDQVRAGQLYSRVMFDTQAEALEFVQKMQRIEPDQMFSVEAVEARQVWN